jgi:DNA mismatch repair protein MutS
VVPSTPNFPDLRSELAKYRPAECLIPPGITDDLIEIIREAGAVVTCCPDDAFSQDEAEHLLRAQFGAATFEGIMTKPAAMRAAGAALRYARETQASALTHIRTLGNRGSSDILQIDAVTMRNLELMSAVREKDGMTLRKVMDHTLTAMGSRLFSAYLTRPLLSVKEIEKRLDAVEFFIGRTQLRTEVQALLRRCADIERISGRIAYGNAGPRDLVTLGDTLQVIPKLKGILTAPGLDNCPPEIFTAIEAVRELPETADLILRAITDNPPALVRNGGVIKEGYCQELDELRRLSSSGKDWIAELQQEEREKTGIKSLKIGYTSVFGYYIEVTRPNLSLVPPRYERKQTTTSGERFTVPELREKEALIASADTRVVALETEIFNTLLGTLGAVVSPLQEIAQGIAMLDLFSSLAGLATRNNYVRPVVDDGPRIVLRDARHPVVEERMPGAYVPNDTLIDSTSDQVLVITGANMAGKSTYMRTVALVTIMAQMGSFVPARHAQIGIVDRIFTRVGAFDDLASGQSTFMVEMLELANILNHVSPRSLVILDEIGRGTGTLDGASIARAALEFLHGKGTAGPRTFFATHFHELVSVVSSLPRVKNYHFAVKDTGKDVIFLRKLIPGATDRSYGIHVARLAGVPKQVIERASVLMKEAVSAGPRAGMKQPVFTQMLLVDAPEVSRDPLRDEISALDLNSMTPLSALQKLYELREKAITRHGDSNGR